MKHINILFLGAAKRVSLVERFIEAGRKLNIKLGIFSCEKDDGFYPVSTYAKILKTPKFHTGKFQGWLARALKKYAIKIVIPSVDPATIALSKFALRNRAKHPSTFFAVSEYSLCRAMFDKKLAYKFFKEHSIPTIPNTFNKFPKVIKPVKGSASKGITIVNSPRQLRDFSNSCVMKNYIIGDYINGTETTVDFYVSPDRGFIGAVFRNRLEISDGEVMVARTKIPRAEEQDILNKAIGIKGWAGCITLQYIMDKNGKVYIIEINPRFGGGATCAIEAGLDMPLYILSEYLKIDFTGPDKIKNIFMTRARRDFFIRGNDGDGVL